jgi:pimeloyl-ACP methyl ester carboxylesterase
VIGRKRFFRLPGAFTGPMNYYRASGQDLNTVIPPNRPKVQSPTLIIWGEKDFALEREIAAMSAQEGGSNCKVVFLPEATHFLQWDHPDEVNKLIKTFIA